MGRPRGGVVRRSPPGGVVRRSRAALPLLGVAVEVPVRAPGRFVAAPQHSAVRAPVSAEAGLGSPAQRGPAAATAPVGVLARACAVPLGALACPGVLCGLAPSLSASCLAPASLLATRFSTGSVLWRRLMVNTHGSNRKGQPRGADPSESCTPPSSPIPRLLRAFCTSRHSPVCFPVSQGFLPSALPFVPSRYQPTSLL